MIAAEGEDFTNALEWSASASAFAHGGSLQQTQARVHVPNVTVYHDGNRLHVHVRRQGVRVALGLRIKCRVKSGDVRAAMVGRDWARYHTGKRL